MVAAPRSKSDEGALAMQVAIFDLDHTLVRRDSFATFSRHLILRDWWRAGLALLLAPIVAALLLPPRTRVVAGSIVIWCGTVGVDERDLHRLMDLHVAAHLAPGLICQAAVEALLEHQREGVRVLVATGCVAALAERVCCHLGLGSVEIVGSSLRRYWGGWVAERHCFGPNKVAMLLERGVGQRWDWVYTDSAFDLPLLRSGDRRFLVNPTAQDRRTITAALAGEVVVVDWD
jgi:phosphatidylglycerophosphatase C